MGGGGASDGIADRANSNRKSEKSRRQSLLQLEIVAIWPGGKRIEVSSRDGKIDLSETGAKGRLGIAERA